MKIAHWAPFAPFRCGLYEAARDCARADSIRGHEVLFCDTGVVVGGVRAAPEVGAIDIRPGWVLKTSPWAEAHDADLWVLHDVVNGKASECSSAPYIFVVHARPLAAFRPEQAGTPGSGGYSLVKKLASWPRTKAIVTHWDEFAPHWELVAGDKLRSTGDPPLDRHRFTARGNRYEFADPGEFNLLISDSWRVDVDIYEVAVACYHAAKQRPGTKVHFWAVEKSAQGNQCWEDVWSALREIGALGEVHVREKRIERVYRAADAVVSPHVIAVRTISEALACGTPVVAARGCRYTPYQGDPHNALDMAAAIVRCLDDVEAGTALADADAFDLATYGERIESIYEEALGLVPELA